MSPDNDTKAQAQARFGQYAQGYVTSEGHAKGDELDWFIDLTQPQPGWRVLDVATGGGHTALKFAPHVARVVAADLTPPMLQAARAFIDGEGMSNVAYVATDSENLAFAANTFDLATCRIAPHHFPDCFRFVQECARVLKPGGLLLIQDHVLPDEEKDARYIDSFQRLRDPSHHRAFAEYEWQGMYLDAGLTIEHTQTFFRSMKLLPWAERQGCTPEVIERLHILLAQAPPTAAEWLNPQHVGTKDATFEQDYIIILGRKPGL